MRLLTSWNKLEIEEELHKKIKSHRFTADFSIESSKNMFKNLGQPHPYSKIEEIENQMNYFINNEKEYYEESVKLINALELTAIRDEKIEDRIKKSTCNAQIKTSNTENMNINYTAQITSDGELFVKIEELHCTPPT